MATQTSDFLQSVRVLELGERVAAAACGGLLAQLGAEVVLVEPPAPRADHKWRNRAAAAAGKRSIVVDRASAAGRRTLQALADGADVVLLSSDVTAADRALWSGERPRRQIVCDITAFGHDGPLAGLALSEPLVQAYAGVADTMGRRDGPPALIGAPMLDMETAVYAASAIVAALRVRRRQGAGQRIDMALFDVGVNALLTFIPLHLTGRYASRSGNRHPISVPWNAYPARDGWALICAPTNELWKRVCQAMGRPALADDPRFVTSAARLENIPALDAAIGDWVATLTVEDCIARLAKAAVPCGPIVALDRLAEEPNLARRGMVRRLPDPAGGGSALVPGAPVRLAGGEGAVSPWSIPARDADRAALLREAAAHAPPPERITGDPVLDGPPLAGVRAVEVGMNTVAPLACRQLGALGADVIKIEPPTGDTNRWNAPLHPAGDSYVFAMSNTDKRGLVLNLREEGDRATLFRLLAGSDLMMENLKPGSLDRLGVGGPAMRARFAHLTYCSVNGFGYDTVYPGRPALDSVIQGMSGAMSASVIDGEPTKTGISIADQLGGQFGLLAMLAALERRERTGGDGACFDIAMQDCAAWATQTLWNGEAYPGPGVRIVAAQDGHVAVEGDDAALTPALGGASLADAVRALTSAAVVARLAGVPGCAAAPVLSVGEALAHPQAQARGLFVERPAADGRQWMVLESPLRLLSTPARVRSAMPALGMLDPGLARELDLAPRAVAVPAAAGSAVEA